MIVLCVDLTEQVLAEAVASHADHIICYAPAISPEQPLRKVSVHDRERAYNRASFLPGQVQIHWLSVITAACSSCCSCPSSPSSS